MAVSYTHLDVYKRQLMSSSERRWQSLARNNAPKIELTAYDDLFQTDESRAEAKLSKIRDIPLSQIDEFPDHPLKVLMDEDMQQLVPLFHQTRNKNMAGLFHHPFFPRLYFLIIYKRNISQTSGCFSYRLTARSSRTI